MSPYPLHENTPRIIGSKSTLIQVINFEVRVASSVSGKPTLLFVLDVLTSSFIRVFDFNTGDLIRSLQLTQRAHDFALRKSSSSSGISLLYVMLEEEIQVFDADSMLLVHTTKLSRQFAESYIRRMTLQESPFGSSLPTLLMFSMLEESITGDHIGTTILAYDADIIQSVEHLGFPLRSFKNDKSRWQLGLSVRVAFSGTELEYLMYAVSSKKRIKVIKYDTGEKFFTLALPGTGFELDEPLVASLCQLHDECFLFVVDNDSKRVVVFDADSGNCLHTIAFPLASSFYKIGKLVVHPCVDGSLLAMMVEGESPDNIYVFVIRTSEHKWLHIPTEKSLKSLIQSIEQSSASLTTPKCSVVKSARVNVEDDEEWDGHTIPYWMEGAASSDFPPLSSSTLSASFSSSSSSSSSAYESHSSPSDRK